MLRIRVALAGINRPVNSLSLARFAVVTVVPSCVLDMTRVTQAYDTVYLYLPAIHTDKAFNATPALLHGSAVSSKNWAQIIKHRLAYQRPADAKAGECVLQLNVQETVSDPMPTTVPNNTTEAGKQLGVWEKAILNNADEPPERAARVLQINVVASTRIGLLKIGFLELVEIYQALSSASELERTYTLYDLSCKVIERGHVSLTFERMTELPDGGGVIQISPFNPTVPQGGGGDAIDSEHPFTLSALLTIHRRSQRLRDMYTKAYLRMFPDLSSHSNPIGRQESTFVATQKAISPVAFYISTSTDSSLPFIGTDGEEAEEEVRIPTRLTTRAPVSRYHAPTASIDGNCHVPFGFFYYRPIVDKFLNTYQESYLGRVLDTLCFHYRFTKMNLVASIHNYLDNNMQQGSPAGAQFLAAVRIVGLLLTFYNTSARYRADMAIGDGITQASVEFMEDIALALGEGLLSEDCDGMDYATHFTFCILWTGKNSNNPRPLWQSRDKVFLATRDALVGGKALGHWDDLGLDAVQRLLFYYCPMSLEGPAGAARAGNDESSFSFTSLAQFDTLPSNVKSKLNSTARTMRDDDMVAHRWSVMLPIVQVTNALHKCYDLEVEQSSTRHPEDKILMERVNAFDDSLKHYAPRKNWDRMPSILLESTFPTNPFCIMGASHWCKTSSDAGGGANQAALTVAESESRLYNYQRKSMADHIVYNPVMYDKGVMGVDEGTLQLLPGDSVARISGSSFYKMATCGNIPILGEIFGTPDFTCAFLGPVVKSGRAKEGNVDWGVDIEDLFATPTNPTNFLIAMSLHRMPMSIRKSADEIGRLVHKWFPPNYTFFYGEDQVHFSQLSGNQGGSTGIEAFETQMLVLSVPVVSEGTRSQLMLKLRERYTDVRVTEQLLFPYSSPTLFVSYKRK